MPIWVQKIEIIGLMAEELSSNMTDERPRDIHMECLFPGKKATTTTNSEVSKKER